MNFSKKLKFAFAFSAFSLSFLMVASPAKNDFKKTFFTLYDGESISTVMAAPINITNNTSVTSTFSVMLLNDVLDAGLTGTTITNDHVSKTWIVQSSSATTSGSGIDLELTWDASDEVGTPSSYDVVVYNEQQNSWARLNGNLGSVQTSGSTKTLSISGVTEDFTSPLLLAVAPAPAPPAPAITSFSPASGEVGDVVTITGSNFDLTASNNKVYFGSVFAVVNSATTTQLQVVVPKSATHSPITVVSSGGVSKTPTAFRVTNSDISGRSITGSNFGNNIEFSSIGGVTGDLMMAAADFDLDGMVDLVKVGSGNARVHINQLTTSGTITSAAFDAGTNFSVLGSARSVVVDDINGDGKLDIVTGSSSGVSILINTTTGGTLSFATKYDISSGNTAIRVADFDSDGKLDIAAINSSQVNIFLNQSTSNTTSFGSANVVSLSTTGFNGLDVGDMDGDGLYDIVATKSGTTNILVNGSSSGTISFSTPVSLSYGHSYVSVVDLDVDGDNDLFLYHTVVNNNYQSGSLSSTDFSNFTNTYGTDGDNLGLTPADFNGDGYPEVVSGTTWDKMWVYVNSASGNAVSASTISSRWYPRQNLYCGSCGNGLGVDVDGDNKVDAVSSMRTFTKFVITQNEMQPMPSISISGSLSIIEKCQNAASSDQTLTLSGSNLTANVSVPSNSHLEYSIDGGSTWNTSLSIAPSSGSVSETLLVRAKSAVNSDVSATSFSISSTGATSVAVSYEIDVLTPPAVANATISTPSGTAISYTPTVTNGVSNAMYTWTVASANSNVTGEVANSTPSYTFDATLTSTTAVQEQVTYTVTPYTETPGSCPGTPFTLTVTVNPVPTLSSASSLSGYVTEEITLTGTNLSYITSVLVGGQSATFTVNSSTEIVFEVPQNSTGSIVVSDGVSSASLSGFTYLVATTASSVPTASVEGITWHDLMFGSNWDPLDDQQAVAETDLVGDANNVLTQVGSSKMIINGQALDDYYYFRTRMGEADPNTSIYLGLDLDGDNLAEVFVEANNKAQTPYVAYHIADPTKSGVSPSQTGWLNSTNNTNVELQLTGSESQITRYTTGADMENSNQSDDDDWVEWAFSEESLKSFASNALSLNIDGNSAIALFLFTSTSQTANGDIAGIDDNTADLTSSWSDLGIVIYASLNSVSSGEIITPTVTSLSTTNATPTISGYWGGDQGGGDVISIVFNGITYTTSSPELTLNNNAWSITLTSANALVNSGSYDVAVSVTRSGTTVTDETTNEVTFTSDAVAPVVLAQDITLPLDATGNGSITTSDVDNGTTDNSGSFTLSLDITSFTCADLGANTVTLTATDASGNTSSATATVTVVDNIDPTITAPAAVTVNVAAGACSTALTNVTLGTPTTADNCSIASTTNDAPTSFPLGATTVTWTVTDGSGNTATASQVVTVVDNLAPVLSCPSNMVVYGAADSTLTSVSWSAATATDNCSLDTVFSDVQIGTFLPLGTTVVTYVAIDGSGNSDTCSFDISVVDTVSPVITSCPSPISQNNDIDSCGAQVVWSSPSYYDNSGYFTVTASHTSGDYFPVGTTTVAITVADTSGNSAVCEFDVVVTDNQIPNVLPYNNVAITLGTDGMYTLAVNDVDSASYDNCGITVKYLSKSFFNCNDVPSATTWLVVEDIHGNKDSALVSLQVSLPATPVLSVLPTINDVLCYGEATGSIQASVSGGVAPYTYNWSNGSTTFDATNLSIGTYWYEVTDTNGCYTTDTLLVNEPAPLTASTVKSIYPGGYNVSINGTSDGSITTTASGGIMPYTFDWNNGAFSTQNLTGIPAGVYALVMTDSNGCVYNLSDTLTEPTRLVATATSLQSVICPDDTTGIVLAAASGAVPPYSYSWDFGSTTDYNTGLTYGIYTVTVTDTNGATATDTVLVDALDYDCDGIYNVDEGGTPNGGGGNGDLDGDGIPNEEDEDSDGDGLLDSEEFDYDNDGVGFDDCDGDGIPNFLDPDLCDLLVPAVFTPNGDGDNDYWEIMGIGAFPDNNVKVFNRWGEFVYFKEGYNNEFNGRANTRTQMNGGDGLLPTGTYYYVVKVYETGDTYTGYVYITK